MERTAETTGHSKPVAGTSSSNDYPLLVHPRSHSMQDSSLNIDDGILGRQKRRRTSPQDHAILEAAYQRNSKPDKNERNEIVGRVALGEKEVQIWFQNRRQNDRRKSRPLLPHELVPHFRNGVPAEVLRCSPGLDTTKKPDDAVLPQQAFSLDDGQHGHVRGSSVHALLNPTPSAQSGTPTSPESKSSAMTGPKHTAPSSLELARSSTTTPTGQIEGKTSATDTPSTNQSSSGKKRSIDEMREIILYSVANVNKQLKMSTSQASVVRLSMTPDGAVKVKTTNEETPSPPKVRPQPPVVPVKSGVGLQQSQSALGASGFSEKATFGQGLPPKTRGRLGRSRDTRTWEFFCDSGARESLSSRAETERTGSAVGAINLIRSQSQKSNGPSVAQKPMSKTSMVPVAPQRKHKLKLARAQSSMARLQIVQDRQKGKASSTLTQSPSDDSDKENWAPGTMNSLNALRRTQPNVRQHPFLEDNDARSGRLYHIVQLEEEDGQEKEQELDCVQGLLGLSQGAWQ